MSNGNVSIDSFLLERLRELTEGELKLILVSRLQTAENELNWDDLREITGYTTATLEKAFRTLRNSDYKIPAWLLDIYTEYCVIVDRLVK